MLKPPSSNESPAFNIILLAMFQNSSIHNRDQIVNALMQGNEPDEQEMQMQQMAMELQMQQAQATNKQINNWNKQTLPVTNALLEEKN